MRGRGYKGGGGAVGRQNGGGGARGRIDQWAALGTELGGGGAIREGAGL